MYTQCYKRLFPSLGSPAVGPAPGVGLVGRSPEGPLAQTKMGSASAWARFFMGLGKRRRERRSRPLGVVGMAVGCAPGGGCHDKPGDMSPPSL